MSHEWDRGVLATSSWHREEEIAEMLTAQDMIRHGRRSGAWPLALAYAQMMAVAQDGSTLAVPGLSALVAQYEQHEPRVLGAVGGRYRHTTPAELDSLCEAAVEAGAKPTGAFSLRNGSRVLATFEVGSGSGIVDHLMLADSFDGSLKLTAGTSSVRVVCANTLSAAMSADGEGMARLRHTASLKQKIGALREAIGEAVRSGSKVRATFDRASDMVLSRARAQAAFDLLFPPAAEDATIVAKSRAENVRHEARLAAQLPINAVGTTKGNLATLWNAATYLVDRRADGSERPARGDADKLDSLLFGARSKRVAEIQQVVELVMTDGSIVETTVPKAIAEFGVGDNLVGTGKILASMFED